MLSDNWMRNYGRWLLCFIGVLGVTWLRAQEVPKIRIDPAQAYVSVTSDFFDQVEYIPLENNKESIVGDIYDMAVTDSSCVISDLDNKSIFFFSLDGNFLKKINGFIYFVFDRHLNQIASFKFSNDQTKLYLNYFTLKGTTVGSEITINLTNNVNTVGKSFSLPLGNDFFLLSNTLDVKGKKTGMTQDFFPVYSSDSLFKTLIPVKEMFWE